MLEPNNLKEPNEQSTNYVEDRRSKINDIKFSMRIGWNGRPEECNCTSAKCSPNVMLAKGGIQYCIMITRLSSSLSSDANPISSPSSSDSKHFSLRRALVP